MRPDKIRGNVFVANLPHGLTDAQLAEAFDPYGIVLIAYLARDPATGETRGHGLVQLAPDRAVEDAVAGLNATGIAGRRIEHAGPTRKWVSARQLSRAAGLTDHGPFRAVPPRRTTAGRRCRCPSREPTSVGTSCPLQDAERLS